MFSQSDTAVSRDRIRSLSQCLDETSSTKHTSSSGQNQRQPSSGSQERKISKSNPPPAGLGSYSGTISSVTAPSASSPSSSLPNGSLTSNSLSFGGGSTVASSPVLIDQLQATTYFIFEGGEETVSGASGTGNNKKVITFRVDSTEDAVGWIKEFRLSGADLKPILVLDDC